MRRRIALTAVLLAMLAVSGCTGYPAEPARPSDLFEAARQSDSAPEGFNDGLPRTSCGEVTLKLGEQLPAHAVDCMDSAIGRLDAELAVVSPTDEGDPIVAFYRTSADAPGVERFTDSEFDKYRSEIWSHEACPATTTIRALEGCSEG